MEKLGYSVKDLADATPYSQDTIRRALRATDPTVFPPPLMGEQDQSGRWLILRAQAEDWLRAIQEQPKRGAA